MFGAFQLHRKEDPTGVSGTGLVADGVRFPDGTCVVRWRGAFSTTTVHESLASIEHIHLHAGRTELKWLWRAAAAHGCICEGGWPEGDHQLLCPVIDYDLYRATIKLTGPFVGLADLGDMYDGHSGIACSQCELEMMFEPDGEMMNGNPLQIHIKCKCGETGRMYVSDRRGS